MAARTAIALVLLLVASGGCLDPIKEAVGADRDVQHPEALLRGDPYDRLIVEIDHVAGYEPSQLALDGLKQRLQEVTAKKEIRILEPTVIDAQGGGYSPDDIRRIHLATFDRRGDDHAWQGAATLHIMYLDGDGSADPSDPEAPGFQGIYVTDWVGGEQTAAIALLPDQWRGATTPLPALGQIPAPGAETFNDRWERAVLIHELGHALGLVGTIPEQDAHHAEEDPGHSSNPDSVMHSGLVMADESVVAFLRETGFDPVWEFDAKDLADLKAYREA